MAKKNKSANGRIKEKKEKYPILTSKLRRWTLAILMFLSAVIIVFSFFNRAGKGGELIFEGIYHLIGRAIFIIPLLFSLGGLIFLKPEKKRIYSPIFIAIFILILGFSGIFGSYQLQEKYGGWLGYFLSFPFSYYFGFWISFFVFSALILIGVLIFWEFLPHKKLIKPEESKIEKIEKESYFKIKTIEPLIKREKEMKQDFFEKPEKIDLQPLKFTSSSFGKYKSPPLELLEEDEEKPSSGDIEANCLQIKKTLQNFGISVEMSEVNIGPTVTQYTLKPADGIKLSKITTLNNDLSLALASHPLRIEAPIPGKAAVGIEVPNKVRAKIRLRGLIGSAGFRNSPYPLTISLGRDVSGTPVFADLGKMPHLLVAGSTGSGKTICLNSIILSLIYRNSPQILKFILIDPKRVEFPIYNSLPHLLLPVILTPKNTINILNWLTKEMERRFELLAEVKARNIIDYNEILTRKGKEELEIIPYIVLIIDELADLMAAKGREIEAAIVRLAQMSRAVGIYLIIATQRPSVEVITGLIKANITSRIAFQVASQIDSRTILDMAGAETLLGEGDMLFINAALTKPKRIQGIYVNLKEIKKVVDFCQKENPSETDKQEILMEDIEKEIEKIPETSEFLTLEEDPLYEEAKKVVIEAGKASASLLQRRLKIGYARAARLLDIMEEKGLIGPLDGAKPRNVYEKEIEDENQGDGWRKI